MYELVAVTENTHYMDCPAKIGMHVDVQGGVWLIDSGNDKEAGKRVLRVLDERGWRLLGIINTHSNADHCGGNAFLAERTGCRILASGIEAAFVRYPILEPSYLYGGYPCRDLRNKFLMAPSSPAVSLDDAGLPEGFSVFDLPGHYFGMVGVRTPDDVCFVGDSLFGPTTLAKYHAVFLHDVGAHLQTLDMLEVMRAVFFVPSHVDATDDLAPLIKANRDKVHEIVGVILGICSVPMAFDGILKGLMDSYGLKLDWNQYVLVGSTLRSYLAYLYDDKRLGCSFDGNLMTWCAVG